MIGAKKVKLVKLYENKHSFCNNKILKMDTHYKAEGVASSLEKNNIFHYYYAQARQKDAPLRFWISYTEYGTR